MVFEGSYLWIRWNFTLFVNSFFCLIFVCFMNLWTTNFSFDIIYPFRMSSFRIYQSALTMSRKIFACILYIKAILELDAVHQNSMPMSNLDLLLFYKATLYLPTKEHIIQFKFFNVNLTRASLVTICFFQVNLWLRCKPGI